MASSLLFGLGLLPLLSIGLSYLLPQNGHDTEWVPGRYAWNYRIDALFGMLFWLAALAAWFRWIRTYGEVRPLASGPPRVSPRSDYSLSYLYANLVAMPLTLGLFLGPLLVFWWVHLSDLSSTRIDAMSLWTFVAAMTLSPLLAGVLYVPALAGALRALGMPRSSISWGVRWAALSPFVHCNAPMEMGAYRMVLILPGVLLGVVPSVLGVSLASPALTAFGAAGLSGWALLLHLLWRSRRVPNRALVLDIVGRTGLLVVSSEHGSAV